MISRCCMSLLVVYICACSGEVSQRVEDTANTHTDAGGSAGVGANGGAGGSTSTCLPDSPRLYGVPFDQSRTCADTEAMGTIVACIDPVEVKAGYFCARRQSDGAKFIGLSIYYKPVIDAPGWESCPWNGEAPIPCYGLTCERGAPPSTCSLAETTKQFGCGDGVHDRDKNCCLRRECASDTDCSPDQSCRNVDGLTGWECWSLGTNNTCDCGGYGGVKAPRLMCVEKSELLPDGANQSSLAQTWHIGWTYEVTV